MFRREISPTLAAKLFFGALDEMATNWILSRRKYSLAAEADAIVDSSSAGSASARSPEQRPSRPLNDAHSHIRQVAVLGAGTMGAQIAAHFANAGVPVLLLDVTRDAARDGLARARKLKPDPFFYPTRSAVARSHRRLRRRPCTRSATADWIIEAVVERLDVKQALFERVDRHRAPHAIVSSNTSGIPDRGHRRRPSEPFARHMRSARTSSTRRGICGCSKSFRRRRPTRRSSRPCAQFADHRLGKGVVPAKDTPNFIANRIGLYGVMQIFQVVGDAASYTIEEIDAITGPAIGRPKSATFRTMDLAGIDVLAHVVRNLAERLPNDDDREVFALPPIVEELIARGWVGAKAGQGFYKKDAERRDPHARSRRR